MKSAQEAWDVLKKEFKGADKVISIKLQNYWRNFDNLSMKENESVKDFSSRVAEIVNQIKGCGDTISEKKVVERILRSLPQKFEHIVAVIEETKDKSQLSRYELFSSLEAHEGRVNGYTNQPLEQVFQVKANLREKKSNARQEERGFSSSYRGSSSRRRGGSGQNHGRGYGRKPSLDVQRSGTECQICKKPGHESKSRWHRCTRCKISNHSKRDCWFKEKAEAADAKANFAKENDVEKLFYSSMDSEHSYKETWFLDSGCNHHITGNRDSFAMLDDKFSTQVELGDSKRVSIEGQGVVAVFTEGGNKKHIHDVYYSSKITHNLLSVGQIMKDGYKLIFDNDRCDIINKKNNLRVAAVKMNANGLFPFETGKLQTYALKCRDLDESYLWHLRYGHLNIKSLQLLEQKGMVTGLPTIHSKDRVCEGCIYGKMHQFPFPKTAWRARSPLELVHADICGPIRSASLGNKQYFILFVDDFTRMIWTYFLDRKSDAFSTFLHFKALVENQSGCLIKALRTDCGGEFIYKPFLKYCKENGILQQFTVRHTPQQNGVAERKNRTIEEMARSMLKGKGLPNKFWAEAVNTTVYILNRSPTKAVQNRTPFEAWYDRKPVVNQLKVFGCVAYARMLPQNREKFDEKGEKFIFIGYSDESKGYRLYNPKTNQLVLSRDVIFDELAVWNWDDNDSQVPVLLDGAGTIPFADVAGPTAGTQSRMEGESLSTEGESSSTTAPTDDSESDSPQSPNEPSLYVKVGEKGNFLIVCLYVDDVIYAGTDIKMVEDFKLAMMKKFEMSDLGLMRYFLGFQVKQSSGEIFISQEKYVEDLLKKFQMLSCKLVPTAMTLNEKLQQEDDSEMADEKLYRSLVGSLIYLTNTRPDIVQPVSVLSRFMSKPSKVHYATAKRVLRFLQGTMKHGLRYVKESNNDLVGFTDSDWAGSLEDRRSTSAYLFCLGSKVISWSSRKQNTVALSSAEAEYSAATSAACEAVWLRRIMADLQQKHTLLFGERVISAPGSSEIATLLLPVYCWVRSLHLSKSSELRIFAVVLPLQRRINLFKQKAAFPSRFSSLSFSAHINSTDLCLAHF
ncbi:hypothetical protein ZIOFF_072026 [Zingiber officinale]|uniref:Integrase catalytic domain-containing protein n=1 Tax=Zingiber officinale TaxID=94328 RepID=A0A8J5C4K2_ZINOF|nr:hypothetical protein ZIOFF_072026 [Zingiber officinale]